MILLFAAYSTFHIPIVWDRFQEEAEADLDRALEKYEEALVQYEADLAEWNKAIASEEVEGPIDEQNGVQDTNLDGNLPDQTESSPTPPEKDGAEEPPRKRKRTRDPKPTPPDVPESRMKEGEVENFLRLAAALRLFLGASVTTTGIARAKKLFTDYLLELEEVCVDLRMIMS